MRNVLRQHFGSLKDGGVSLENYPLVLEVAKEVAPQPVQPHHRGRAARNPALALRRRIIVR
jgi:hypothetical protein